MSSPGNRPRPVQGKYCLHGSLPDRVTADVEAREGAIVAGVRPDDDPATAEEEAARSTVFGPVSVLRIREGLVNCLCSATTSAGTDCARGGAPEDEDAPSDGTGLRSSSTPDASMSSAERRL